MQAVQFHEFGDPSVLQIVDAPVPHAGPGQIRIAVEAASVNPADWKIRSGLLGDAYPLPGQPGLDAAGVVDEVGEGVTDVAPGDAVFGFAVGGGYAEHTLLEHYAVKPAAVSWGEAAGLPITVETAARIFDTLALQAGQTVLLNGAAGGVGQAAVQLAVARGARVIGTASEPAHALLRELGATPTTYGDGLVDRVRALAPGGVDLAFDLAGQGALPDLIALVGDPGRVLTISDLQAAGPLGVQTSSRAAKRAYYALSEVAELIADGRFTPAAARAFPLAEAAAAQRLSQDGHVRGKLVLIPDSAQG